MAMELLSAMPPTYPVHWLTFDSQEFIDDVVNAVIQISRQHFDEMELCATQVIGVSGEESQAALAQGMGAVFQRFLTQVIGNDLSRWEEYCQAVCFNIPDGLVLPKMHEASRTVCRVEEEKLDAKLAALRTRKADAKREAAKLQRELRSLETFLTFRSTFDDVCQKLQLKGVSNDLFDAAPSLCEKIREANVLRAEAFKRRCTSAHAFNLNQGL